MAGHHERPPWGRGSSPRLLKALLAAALVLSVTAVANDGNDKLSDWRKMHYRPGEVIGGALEVVSVHISTKDGELVEVPWTGMEGQFSADMTHSTAPAGAIELLQDTDDTFELEKYLGDGSNGMVYLVKSLVDDMPAQMAMKTTVLPLQLKDEESDARWDVFAEECALMLVAGCRGPGVVHAFSPTPEFQAKMGDDGTFVSYYFPAFREFTKKKSLNIRNIAANKEYWPRCLMEVADTDMSKYLRKQEYVNLRVVQRSMYQLLQGLKTLHEAVWKIHGDIKPNNVLVFNADRAEPDFKLGDVGNTRGVFEGFVIAGCPTSSASYQAPEVWDRCKEYEKTNKVAAMDGNVLDLFPLGLILFNMLSGTEYEEWFVSMRDDSMFDVLEPGWYVQNKLTRETSIKRKMTLSIIEHQKNHLKTDNQEAAKHFVKLAVFLMQDLLRHRPPTIDELLENPIFKTDPYTSGDVGKRLIDLSKLFFLPNGDLETPESFCPARRVNDAKVLLWDYRKIVYGEQGSAVGGRSFLDDLPDEPMDPADMDMDAARLRPMDVDDDPPTTVDGDGASATAAGVGNGSKVSAGGKGIHGSHRMGEGEAGSESLNNPSHDAESELEARGLAGIEEIALKGHHFVRGIRGRITEIDDDEDGAEDHPMSASPDESDRPMSVGMGDEADEQAVGRDGSSAE